MAATEKFCSEGLFRVENEGIIAMYEFNSNPDVAWKVERTRCSLTYL